MKGEDCLLLVIVVAIASAVITTAIVSNWNKAKYLDDGRKFVTVDHGDYVLGEYLFVEKLPNGFYRAR